MEIPNNTVTTTEEKAAFMGENVDPSHVSVSERPFKDFLFRSRYSKIFITLTGLAILVQFIIFKYFYPSAGFIDGDSYVYIETAYGNFSINTYPIGYSKFLRLFSVLTISNTALVAFQYLMIQSSSLLLVLTLTYFYKPGKVIFTILYASMVFNPVFLFISNYVSSDALFLSLSLVWFTLLIWILHKPGKQLIYLHAFVILLAFTVRYNALFYPVIAALAFIISRQPWKIKVVGIVSSMVLIAGFMWHTSNQYKRLTGIRQFSPFSGWQMANNALYIYRFVQDEPPPKMPKKFAALDKAVRTYFDTTRNIFVHQQEMFIANTWYMWDPKSPLQRYMNQQFKKDSTATSLKKWASMGPLYNEYGSFLIKEYPIKFAQYFLIPNSLKYYAPPVEFLDMYNMGKDSIAPIAQMWFGFESRKLKMHFKDLKVNTLNYYPILVGTMNVVFVFSLIGFVVLKGFRHNKPMSYGLLLAFGLWAVNCAFSIFASQIALRFQMTPILIFFSFGLLLIDYVWRAAFNKL